MDETQVNDLVDAVQRQIAFLLKDLEARTGQYVDAVRLDDIEVTNIGSPRQEYLRSVRIDLRRPPGAKWST